jgi:23S rRNA (pseudouridine1915-N3)-methyltransferase
MKIKIIAIGKIKTDSNEFKLMDEYIKRLPKNSIEYIDFEIKNFANEKDKKEKEADKIISYLNENDYIVCLDENGANIDSIAFSNLIKEQTDNSKNIVFIIGGAFGLGDQILQRANKSIAFGKMVMPHKIVRILLTEQIYRANSIINNHPYHKE